MKLLNIMAASLAIGFASNINAQDINSVESTYLISITNITAGQSFTPILAATHNRNASFFKLGEAPSQALADMAEGGETAGLMMALMESGDGYDMQTSGEGLIGPGETKTIEVISAGTRYDMLSIAGMLLPTNDTFIALNSVNLPRWSTTLYANAYDAGSEENDELCANIPGPVCGGEPFSEGLGEGYVHNSRGISGEGDLSANAYDWRNPVAKITIQRVK